MSDPLPVIVSPGQLTAPIDSHLVPALIADAGEPAAWRYIEFFTANIRNPNPGCAGKSSVGRARPEACRENRQDAGA